ncbi:MAG TPA: RDD family protein [Streptosporangiaceae bacterium]|nr:RDD family protein [Streptosporangiaceae bacterium]
MTHPPPGGPRYGGSAYGPVFSDADSVGRLAGRWARFGGGVIDAIVVLVIQAILIGPTIRWDRVGQAGYGASYVASRPGTRMAGFLALVIAFLYYWLQHAKWGQTLGKRAARTRLVRMTDGGPVTWAQAAWRAGFSILFALFVNLVTCGFGGILALLDPAWLLWDHRRQALHDKAARTLVIKVDPTAPDPYAASGSAARSAPGSASPPTSP